MYMLQIIKPPQGDVIGPNIRVSGIRGSRGASVNMTQMLFKVYSKMFACENAVFLLFTNTITYIFPTKMPH